LSLNLVYENGLHLNGTSLWFDALEPRTMSFISSARHRVLQHGRLLMSPPTARLVRGVGRGRALVASYEQSFSIGKMRLTLFPAGSVLGAAQLLVEHLGQRLLYSGTVGPLEGLRSVRPVRVARCEVLVIDTPDVPLHPTRQAAEASWESMGRRLSEVRGSGRTPLVLCSALGTAQEILARREPGTRVRAHRAIQHANEEYRRFGVDLHRTLELRARGRFKPSELLLFPASLGASPSLARLRKVEVLDATELGLESANYATLDELEAFVASTGAKSVAVLGAQRRALLDRLEGKTELIELNIPMQGSLFAPQSP